MGEPILISILIQSGLPQTGVKAGRGVGGAGISAQEESGSWEMEGDVCV